MSSVPLRKRPAKSKTYLLQKPRGQFQTRVQATGPEHFAILSVDCGKLGSKFMLADFYATVLIEPTKVPHTHAELQAALDRVHQALAQHDIRDFLVAIERTGEYHRPIQRACRERHWDTRLVHPYATKQYRQPADPNNKTDDTDLAAIFRATVTGFGLVESTWSDEYQQLQILRRHRRDLVQKCNQLQCQIKEKLHAVMPGFAELFAKNHFWDTEKGMFLARRTGSAQAVRELGADGLARLLREAQIRFAPNTLPKLVAWANNAVSAHPHSSALLAIVAALDDDRLEKTRQIRLIEQQLASLVAATPYVLLLAIPGINIVGAADLGGEMGPPPCYANPNGITGRAGLMPCRYQSEGVDKQGPLRRGGNLRLRAALMQVADNLIRHNDYYRARATAWQRINNDPRWLRVKVTKAFSRLAFAMLISGKLLKHPCCQKRHYVLAKLLKFHIEHGTPAAQIRGDLLALCERLPTETLADEAKPLSEQLAKLARKRGPQPVADLISIVLARVQFRQVESERAKDLNTPAPSGEPTSP